MFFSSSHLLLIFTSSHPPHLLLIFSSSHHSHLHIFSSSSHLLLIFSHLLLIFSHLLLIFSSSPHLLTSSHIFSHLLTSSHLHIFSSSHLLTFTSSHLAHLLTSSHIFSHLLTSSHRREQGHLLNDLLTIFSHLLIFCISHEVLLLPKTAVKVPSCKSSFFSISLLKAKCRGRSPKTRRHETQPFRTK